MAMCAGDDWVVDMEKGCEFVVAEHLSKVFPERLGGIGWRRLLGRSCPTFCAVHDLSFCVAPGERVGFVGPNGAGKSTTIKLLAGILRPSTGRVRLFGVDPLAQRAETISRTAVIFGQNSQLWPHLTLADNFQLMTALYSISRADVLIPAIVEQFYLQGLMDRMVGRLSFGERMRSEIAMSLFHGPQLCFFDEPTIGLDILAKDRIRALLRRSFSDSGATLLLTSHDMFDIEHICDRVIVIDKGQLLIDDSLVRLKERHGRMRRISFRSDAEQILLENPHVRIVFHVPPRVQLEVDTGHTTVEQVLIEFLGKYSVADIAIENPSLESIIAGIYRHGMVH
ncbi:MAG: ATP-binding cassette domain-containing protein [Puniceicoccales bacterium]|jgi:ABC-2 type transport system ATP-binding protein|nr:ATP-binding cassette domain-containing protein [Puniceicoccales bacterium]